MKSDQRPEDHMTVVAWIQMGSERRETVIEIPLGEPRDEGSLEELVHDWMQHQYGWGWSGCGYENDFSFMEGSDGASFVVTDECSIPNTQSYTRNPISGRWQARADFEA